MGRPDKAGPHLPEADLAVHIHTQDDDSRLVAPEWTPQGQAWLVLVQVAPHTAHLLSPSAAMPGTQVQLAVNSPGTP